MRDRTPKYATRDVSVLLCRSRNCIQRHARTHGLGVRVANRQYLFSEEDVWRLRRLCHHQSLRQTKG